jgi:hypothetical protein
VDSLRASASPTPVLYNQLCFNAYAFIWTCSSQKPINTIAMFTGAFMLLLIQPFAPCRRHCLDPADQSYRFYTAVQLQQSSSNHGWFVSKLNQIALPGYITGHSFRRGGASHAFNIGLPSEFIQAQGDWKSTAYLQYIVPSPRTSLSYAFRFSSSV